MRTQMFRTGMGRVLCVAVSVMAFTSTSVLAQVNSWTNATSGNWDDPSSWSLGVLPNSSQSVMITNSGWKAVAVNPSTPINSPNSMTVNSLTIIGATNTENTLLLNYFGTGAPLTVLNGLTLQDYAQILNFNSGLVVQGGTVIVTNSQINQDGGFINTMNAPLSLSDSVYNLTNGDFEGGSVSLGYPTSAHFNQYGGTAIITNVGLQAYISGPIQNGISLFGGTLNLPGGMFMLGEPGGMSYFQAGGTNLTTQVTVEPDYGGYVSGFTLNGGLLADSGLQLMAGYETPISIEQNGGSHVITNTLYIAGYAAHGDSFTPAIYYLNGGTLSAGTIELDANEGDSFLESNAITSAETVYAHSEGYYLSHNTHIILMSGTLSCSNYTTDDGQGTLNQSGGALVVSNLLDFGGSRNVGGPVIYYGLYTFTGGTLTASNINITAWSIGDGTTNRISNPGTFSLSHLLAISNAVEQLGSFILVSNSMIDLAGSASQLSFANSSSQTWAAGATLLITDWNGNPSGGGAEQLKFGTDQSGLTAAQLNQIEFQLGTNLYPAKILATGEVVPNRGSTTSGLVNSWINSGSGNWDQPTNWSLGILPNSSQSIMITNSGFKAVAISSSTPINFPGSMSVSNLTITSPTNSANTLLMNFVAAGNPLVIGSTNNPGSLIIGDANSAMAMFSSGLIVNNELGTNNSRLGEFEVNGTFIQSDNSEVVANFLDLNGTYNFTNGMVFVGSQFINGTFNQQGGRNLGTVDMESTNGNYELFDGNMQGNVTLRAGAFNQLGGTNSAALITGNTGVYNLQGGVLVPGDLVVGSPPQNNSQMAGGGINQSGGSNITGNMSMVFGFYNLSNGTLSASSLTLTTNTLLGAIHSAEFHQYGGYNTNGVLNIIGGANPFPFDAFYFLYGGILETPSINMDLGEFILRNATNRVPNLSLVNHSIYQMESGLLVVDQIQVTEAGTGDSEFWHSGGTLAGARNITLANGQWIEISTGAQFGQLQLSNGTNSTLTFQSTSPSIVFSFANSSSAPWASGAILTIQGWRGSLNGGGTNQVLFGSSASGLTAQQVSQIRFSNPAGLPNGTYTSRILFDGEVVPAQLITSGVGFSRQGNNLVLTWPSGWTLQTATNVLGPYNDVNAASPYTNSMFQPQQFFRRRQ